MGRSVRPNPREIIIQSFEEPDGTIITEVAQVRDDVTLEQREAFMKGWAAGRRLMRGVTSTTWVPESGSDLDPVADDRLAWEYSTL